MTLTGRRFNSRFRLPGVPPQLAHSLDLRAQNEHRLPAVLSVEEVPSVLADVKTFHNHGYLSTVNSCGPRLHEG